MTGKLKNSLYKDCFNDNWIAKHNHSLHSMITFLQFVIIFGFKLSFL